MTMHLKDLGECSSVTQKIKEKKKFHLRMDHKKNSISPLPVETEQLHSCAIPVTNQCPTQLQAGTSSHSMALG